MNFEKTVGLRVTCEQLMLEVIVLFDIIYNNKKSTE